jgi:dTDP-4-dehydrorhamnose reductase
MNILVTGANGQLGQCLRDLVPEDRDNWFWTDVSGVEGRKCDYLDITDAESVKKYFVDNAISVCVNCAAYTNVDKAEEDQEMAKKLNADAPKILAEACKIHGTKLIHISTDYVFNGTAFIPLTEDRATFPMSVYGKTKLEGEQNIINSGCKYLIFRTAWLYSEYGNNFVKTMMKLILDKEEISVVDDQIGTPTYARTLAEFIYRIIDDVVPLQKEGIYHFTNEGVCSWFDFACLIRDCMVEHAADFVKMAAIKPVSTKDFYGDRKHAPRPYYSVLNKKKLKNDFNFVGDNWMYFVEKCISKMMGEKTEEYGK